MEEKHEENEFEKELAEMKEWQDNQFNPGHYIGTGRTPRHMSVLSKSPVFLIILGISILALMIYLWIVSEDVMNALSSSWIGLLLSGVFIYGGTARLIERKKNRR